MTYTDPRQRDLRERLDAIRSQSNGRDYYERAMQMYRALIEDVDPQSVVLPPLARSMADSVRTSHEQSIRMNQATDRIWELAQDEQRYPRIMVGLMRLAKP